jgi:endonuclease/exonuclease/phosphatase family metal-dependent hydrolase
MHHARLLSSILLVLLFTIQSSCLAQSESAELQFRVMSFNIRYGTAEDGSNSWDNRKEFLLRTITDYDPDLLGTQECLLFQAEFLRAGLPDHGFVGVGRDDGASGGEMCAVFYRKSMFEKLDEGHFWLSERPDSVASKSWDSALTRMASWIQVQTVSEDSMRLFFVNTHFDHVGEEARIRSAELLLERMVGMAGNLPVIMTGDFNAPADTEVEGPYRVLAGREGILIDTYRALHARAGDEGTFNAFRGDMTGPRIDWILVTPTLKPVEAEIIRRMPECRFPSDHFPVTAVVRLNTARF